MTPVTDTTNIPGLANDLASLVNSRKLDVMIYINIHFISAYEKTKMLIILASSVKISSN